MSAGAAAPAVATTSAITTQTVAATTKPAPGFGGYHGFAGGVMGGFGGRGGFALTVTAVNPNSNTITATGRANSTITITVTGATTYSEAGASVTLAAIQPGEHIAVRGTSATQGALTASAITVLLPQEAGVVSTTSSSSLTITDRKGTAHTIDLTGATRFQKDGQTAALSDIQAGTSVVVQGTSNADGSLTAELVTIQVPRIAGRVAAVNGTSYTVTEGRQGQSVTVSTDSSTVFVTPNGSTAQASSITRGTSIMVEGTLSADGKTLTATRITILPTSTGHGHGWNRGGSWSQGGTSAGGTLGGASALTPATPSTATQSPAV